MLQLQGAQVFGDLPMATAAEETEVVAVANAC